MSLADFRKSSALALAIMITSFSSISTRAPPYETTPWARFASLNAPRAPSAGPRGRARYIAGWQSFLVFSLLLFRSRLDLLPHARLLESARAPVEASPGSTHLGTLARSLLGLLRVDRYPVNRLIPIGRIRSRSIRANIHLLADGVRVPMIPIELIRRSEELARLQIHA